MGTDLAEAFLRAGANSSAVIQTANHASKQAGRGRRRGGGSDEGVSVLQQAIRDRRMDLVSILLRAGADVGYSNPHDGGSGGGEGGGGATALHIAAETGQVDLVRALLYNARYRQRVLASRRRGIGTRDTPEPEPDSESGLLRSVIRECVERAAGAGQIEAIRVLVKAGQQVEGQQQRQQQQQQGAGGDGANKNNDNNNKSEGSDVSSAFVGGAALHAAVTGGHSEVVELVVSWGVDVDAGIADGGDAAAATVEGTGNTEGDARAKHTATALHVAMKAGNTNMARLLLEHGADWTKRDAQGKR